jgi:RNA polymerase sigma-70 factor, ECF subfamily
MAQGSPIVFEEMYTRYQGGIFAICLRMLRNVDDAQEACQETFLKAWQHLGTFREENLQGWLRTIAKHESLNRIRDRRPAISLDEPRYDEEGSASFREIAVSNHALEVALIQMDLARGLRGTTTANRQAIVLRMQGLSYAEIAQVLGASLCAIKTRIWHGREHMRKALPEYSHAEAQ